MKYKNELIDAINCAINAMDSRLNQEDSDKYYIGKMITRLNRLVNELKKSDYSPDYDELLEISLMTTGYIKNRDFSEKDYCFFDKMHIVKKIIHKIFDENNIKY